MPTVEQRLARLRRRRDFLAVRIPQQTVDPHWDKSEHAALSWAIRFLEDHYRPESPEVEQNPSPPGRSESLDFQKHPGGEPTKPSEAQDATKIPPLAPTVPHGIA
jgi:hypothetical protein